mmetsp:Transcript_137600/g.427464  ORF Transcript_137600/g.427464 Transcript_137600/m.427464 type:complete len:249 (-) Transcript_137600:116-862(-)
MVATRVPTRPTTYEMEKGSFSRCISPVAKDLGPFKMAKEDRSVMDPKANSSANFCGEMGRSGRKEKDMDIKKTPKKKTPPNCASLAGDSARAESPDKPDFIFPAPATAADFTDPAAAAAFSLAACAFAAPMALASASFCWLLPCRSLASCCAALPFSDSAVEACAAPSPTFPRLFAISLCQPLACSPHSTALAFSAAEAMPFCASFAAPATCCRTRPAATLAQFHCSPPASRSSRSPPAPASVWGTTS